MSNKNIITLFYFELMYNVGKKPSKLRIYDRELVLNYPFGNIRTQIAYYLKHFTNTATELAYNVTVFEGLYIIKFFLYKIRNSILMACFLFTFFNLSSVLNF